MSNQEFHRDPIVSGRLFRDNRRRLDGMKEHEQAQQVAPEHTSEMLDMDRQGLFYWRRAEANGLEALTE